MKIKIILAALVLLLVSTTIFIYIKNSISAPSKTIVHSIDKKGIYVDGGNSGLEPVSDEMSRFSKTVKGLNEGWENIRLGNSYDTAGQYEEAARAYKKAYEVDPGNRVFSGRKLIETYEKLCRYDEALAVVNEILKTQPLGAYGVEKYTAIRTRLLTAKNQSMSMNT